MALDYLRQYVKQPVVALPPVMAPEAPGRRIEDLLGAEMVEAIGGACLVVDTRLSADQRHGIHVFDALTEVTPAGIAIVTGDPELAFADMSRAVFLDTETTGLNMGAGTYVFLVGAGYFRDGEFRVRQFFLRDPGEELPYLAALETFLSAFSVLVTFNGKAFDWPLLESRFVRHRTFRRAPLKDPPHVDLLHPARRLWKRRLESCALSSLERHVLGVERTEEDVPGWMIPSMYFSYLRTGDARELQRVFYHNLHDILSLATLLVHLYRVASDPLGGLVRHSLDYLSLGRALERCGEIDSALACYEAGLAGELELDHRAEGLTRLAALHKRERRWEAALVLWDKLVDLGGPSALVALIERAKYYEHVERMFLEALEDTQHALNLLELMPGQVEPSVRVDLERRQARVLNRVYRDRAWTQAR